jgi:hypothetical protein
VQLVQVVLPDQQVQQVQQELLGLLEPLEQLEVLVLRDLVVQGQQG